MTIYNLQLKVKNQLLFWLQTNWKVEICWCQFSLWNFCHHDLHLRKKCCGQDDASCPCEISATVTFPTGQNAVDRIFFLPCSDKPELDLIFFKKAKPKKVPPPGFSVNSDLKAWLPAMLKMSWFFSWLILYVTHHMCLATCSNTASSFSFNTPRKSYFLQHHTQTVSVSIPFTAWIMYFLPLWKFVAHGLKSLFLKLALTFHSQQSYDGDKAGIVMCLCTKVRFDLMCT